MDMLSCLQLDPKVECPPAVPPHIVPPDPTLDDPIGAIPLKRQDGSVAQFVGSQYADDGVWVSTSWWGLCLRAHRADTFLRFFAVSLNVKKSTITSTAAVSATAFPPIKMWSAIETAYLPLPVIAHAVPYKYLGIWISGNLDWSTQNTAMEVTVNTRLTALRRAARGTSLSLREASYYLSSSIWGALAYSFGVAPVPWSKLTQWDKSASTTMSKVAGIGNPAWDRMYHPIRAVGQGAPSARALWVESHTTEWLIAVQSPGVLGASARMAFKLYAERRGTPNPLGYPHAYQHGWRLFQIGWRTYYIGKGASLVQPGTPYHCSGVSGPSPTSTL